MDMNTLLCMPITMWITELILVPHTTSQTSTVALYTNEKPVPLWHQILRFKDSLQELEQNCECLKDYQHTVLYQILFHSKGLLYKTNDPMSWMLNM